MKKIVSIVLVLAFLVQTTSQLWIVAAFRMNRDYIAANLCINRFESIPVCKGSCFLEKQLQQNQKNEQKAPDLKTKELNLFYQNNTGLVSRQTFINDKSSSYPVCNTPFLSSKHLRAVFRPPSIVI